MESRFSRYKQKPDTAKQAFFQLRLFFTFSRYRVINFRDLQQPNTLLPFFLPLNIHDRTDFHLTFSSTSLPNLDRFYPALCRLFPVLLMTNGRLVIQILDITISRTIQ